MLGKKSVIFARGKSKNSDLNLIGCRKNTMRYTIIADFEVKLIQSN